LNLRLAEDAAQEDQVRLTRKSEVVQLLIEQMTADVSWVGSALTSQDAATQCKPIAISKFDAYFQSLDPSLQLPTRFAAIEDVRKTWTDETCSQAAQSVPAMTLIEASVEAARLERERAWNQAMQELEIFIGADSLEKGKACIDPNYPDNAVQKRKRLKCLKDGWRALEVSALQKWASTESGQRFAANQSEVQGQLNGRRASLQDIAIQSMELAAVGVSAEVEESWDRSMKELEAIVHESAKLREAQCFQNNPRRTELSRLARSRCLQDGWSRIELAALESWLKTEFGERFRPRKDEAGLHLGKRRTALRAASIRRMETLR